MMLSKNVVAKPRPGILESEHQLVEVGICEFLFHCHSFYSPRAAMSSGLEQEIHRTSFFHIAQMYNRGKWIRTQVGN